MQQHRRKPAGPALPGGGMSFVLPDPFPPPWASEWEEDAEWGLAATLNLNGVKQTFRWIQPGTFLMGSPEDES